MELPLRWDDIRRRKFGDRLSCSGFGHLKFEMPVRHSSGDVKEAVGYKRGEFWAEVGSLESLMLRWCFKSTIDKITKRVNVDRGEG